jgi:hypothetical protein
MTTRLVRIGAEPTTESQRVASVAQAERQATGTDEEQECRVTLLLLGNGAVLAHRFRRPLAAETDDDQQS